MSPGIRAEVKVDAPAMCPIAQASDATGASSYSISKSTDPNSRGTVTEEFMLDADSSIEDVDGASDIREVFSYGEKSVYRFSRSQDIGCPCECVEQFGCPVADVHTRDGSLYLVFHAPDMDGLRDVVTALRDRYPNMDVQRLLRSQKDQAEHDLVFVDRGSLTDRQHEVLETAHRMGYFQHPKRANAGEVAEALGITTSTFTEHLAAAQTKLLDSILDA